jgi:hypothetical protein
MIETKLETAVVLPSGFRFDEVSSHTAPKTVGTPPPSLGPLAAFTGTFRGHGFNTIFRPDSAATPTPLPVPQPPPPPPHDNVLELNLTSETLSFSKSLGSVPNRGMVQGDIFLNGVPYLQVISDITVPTQPIGIHFEPGLWVIVPATTNPEEGVTLVRMASIPHGTTIDAQGTFTTIAGKPTIPAVDITPTLNTNSAKIKFPSQTATTNNSARIPQDLTPFIAAGTITQAILDDPNTILRNHIASQTITSTTIISISTSPKSPLFGGGTDNIAFLLGDPAALTNPVPAGPNAQATLMNATFWIETVEHIVHVPVFKPGLNPPLSLRAEGGGAGQPVPKFLVNPPIEITTPRTIKVTSTQIQYSQEVFLNFNGLTWPHVSVNTLVPADDIPVPHSVW